MKPLRFMGNGFMKFVDKTIIDGIINNLNKGVVLGAQTTRLIQTGNIGFYIFAMVLGIIAILIFNLIL